MNLRFLLSVGLVISAGMDSAAAIDMRRVEAVDTVGCADYQDSMHLIGKIPQNFSYDSKGAAIDGDYAYCLCYQGLSVVDISDPANPRQVALLHLVPYGPSQIVVSGQHAFVSDIFNGLYVVDIADPTEPVIVANMAVPGWPEGIAVAGRFAYLACRDTGFQVVDITNPESPSIVASLATPGHVRKVTVQGRMAYLCDSVAGLLIVDITHPTRPALAGGLDTLREPWNVVVNGDYAYVVDYYDGIQIVDVADRDSPRMVGAIELFGQTVDVDLRGDVLFVLNEMSLYTFDVSIPQSPRLIGNHEVSGQATDIEVTGSVALQTAYSGGCFIIDVGTPANALGVETAELPEMLTSAQIVDGIACATTNYGFRVLDLSASGSVQGSGYLSFYAMFQPENLTSDGSLAFVSFANPINYNGFVVIDISEPDHPVRTRIFNTDAYISGMAATGHYLYCVTGSPTRVDIYDVANAAQPVLMSSFSPTASLPYLDIKIFGSRAVVWNSSTFWIYDISRPSAPQQLGFVTAPGLVNHVQLVGGRLYLSGDSIWVYDTTDMALPVLVGARQLPYGWTEDMAVVDDHVYLSCNTFGVDVYDATDPSDISWAGTIKPLPSDLNYWPEHIWNLQADSGRILFWGPSRISWVKPQCGAPLSVGIDVRPGAAESTVPCPGGNGWLPVAILSGGGFDATTVDPATARLGPGAAVVATYSQRNGRILDVDDDGDIDLVLDFSLDGASIPCGTTEMSLTARTFNGTHVEGVGAVRTVPGNSEAPRAEFSLWNVPNPFNPRTTITFNVPEAGPVRLSVYDVSGRLIRTLVDQGMNRGSHDAVWDGRDSSGREVGSGSYLARLEIGGRTKTLRMGLIR